MDIIRLIETDSYWALSMETNAQFFTCLGRGENSSTQLLDNMLGFLDQLTIGGELTALEIEIVF